MNDIVVPDVQKSLIAKKYALLVGDDPGIRALNAAQKLGISEVVLLASRNDIEVFPLADDWPAILGFLPRLGELMALTRNAHCVHERKGVYDNLSFNHHAGMHFGIVANVDIDLRLFLHKWRFGYAVTEHTRQGDRYSLQFFDKQGGAVHKIYTTGMTELDSYRTLRREFFRPDTPFPKVEKVAEGTAPEKRRAVDAGALERDWRSLKDTHDFFPMLKRHKVDRLQALRLMPGDLANQVGSDAVQQALQQAALRGCEIMVFAGNKGCIQIHTGTVSRLKQVGPWFNVLDDRFNLHLKSAGIEECWVTRKPSDDGIVTALEAYDAQGGLVVQLFGRRKPGQRELPQWREIIEVCECSLSSRFC